MRYANKRGRFCRNFKFQFKIGRIFPVSTPFLPRSYPVPCSNLAAYFRLAVPLLSAYLNEPSGLFSPYYSFTVGLLLYSLPLCKIYLDTIFQLFNFQFKIARIFSLTVGFLERGGAQKTAMLKSTAVDVPFQIKVLSYFFLFPLLFLAFFV